MKGALIVSRKPLVALSYYRKANELQDNADIRYNIIDAYYRLGKYADCNRELHEALDSFPESVKLDKFILKMKPDKPVFSLKSGEYEDVQVIEIYSKDTKDRIYYEFNDGSIEYYMYPIRLDRSMVYKIVAWTENKLGLKSDRVHAEYSIKLKNPVDINTNIRGGEYSQ